MTVEMSVWSKAPYVFVDKGDLSQRVVEAIRDDLSYEVPDAQYTDAWRSGDWDGYHRLFRESSNGSWYFPLGCLSRVGHILDMHGIPYEVDGLERPGRGDIEYGWDTDMELRDYQTDAVTEALQRGHGLVVMPTGTGKTVVGIRITYELQRSTLVLVHRKEIADQWVERMESILGVDVARFYAGDHENGDVQVALYQSVFQDDEIREDVRLDHDVVHFDEAHTVGADTFSDVAMSVTATYRFGYSATPEREDNAMLRVIGGSGPIIADLSVERMIEKGYLAEPEWRILDGQHTGGAYRGWQGEYTAEIVENDARNKMIADAIADLDRPTLVTVERINHGERLEGMVDNAEFVHGDHTDRDALIGSFRSGDVPVLIATRGIVGEGFDVPEIRSFVVAGGLKSSTSMIQQVGRALRPGESGEATVVDVIDRGRWVGDHSEQRIRTYQEYYGEYGP